MKTANTILFLVLFCFSNTKAQQKIFLKIYGDSANAAIYSVKEVENNGFLLFGSRNNPLTNFSELAVIKTNDSGNEDFIKYLGAPDYKYLVLFEQDTDKNYISVQVTNEKTWDSVTVKKISHDFQLNSTKAIPIFTDSFWNGYFSSIYFLPGQGFLVTGQSKGNQSNYYLYFMDENGNVKWHLPPSQSKIKIQFISTFKQLGNNILLMGTGISQNENGTFISIINKSGTEINTKFFNFSPGNEVVAGGITLLKDGNLLFSGHKNKSFGKADVMLAKMDLALDTIWTKFFNNEKIDPLMKDGSQFGAGTIAATEDGGALMIINDVNRFGTLHDYVGRINKSGNLLWSRHLDSSYHITYYSIIETSDGGIAMGGTQNGRFHLLKLNAEGTTSSIRENIFRENKIKIYPNPAENEIYINMVNKYLGAITIEIYDISGKLIKSSYNHSAETIVLQKNDLKAGIYFLKLKDEKGNNFQQKLLLN